MKPTQRLASLLIAAATMAATTFVGLAGPPAAPPALAAKPAAAKAAAKAPGAATTTEAGPAAGDAKAAGEGERRPPELFLAWRRPYGTPGALKDVALRGGEAAQPETLYLSFDPGRDSDKFYGVDCTLLFRVPPGDTLGSLWRFGGGSMNKRNVQIEFPTDDSWGCPRPFAAQGFGAPNYRLDAHTGELQVIYAVAVEQAAPIRTRERYCFARVILPAGSTLDEGDGQAVCVEWVKADFSFELQGDGTSVLGRPVERFVSVNSPGVKACAPFRKAPELWAPPGSPTKPR